MTHLEAVGFVQPQRSLIGGIELAKHSVDLPDSRFPRVSVSFQFKRSLVGRNGKPAREFDLDLYWKFGSKVQLAGYRVKPP
jgi:hypothetical protein